MGVYRFEDLRVWQAAKRQCDRVGALITRPEFRRDRELSGQMNDWQGTLETRDPRTRAK